jgi:hypothetical protein
MLDSDCQTRTYEYHCTATLSLEESAENEAEKTCLLQAKKSSVHSICKNVGKKCATCSLCHVLYIHKRCAR